MSVGLFGLDDESTGLAPPPAGSLVSVAEAGAALGEAFARRPDLGRLIGAASRAAEDYCRRSFAPRGPVDEYLDGTGRPWLYLRRPPVASVEGVTVSGLALDNTHGDQWRLDPDSGGLLRLSRGEWRGLAWLGSAGPVWSRGYRNIRVQYTGGYESPPEPAKQATIILVRHLADSSRNTGVLLSERIGDYEYQTSPTAAKADPPFVVRALLDPYVIPVVG